MHFSKICIIGHVQPTYQVSLSLKSSQVSTNHYSRAHSYRRMLRCPIGKKNSNRKLKCDLSLWLDHVFLFYDDEGDDVLTLMPVAYFSEISPMPTKQAKPKSVSMGKKKQVQNNT